jgi:hypothetical protein
MTSEPQSPDTLSRLQQDLKDVVDALTLLGVKRCSTCRKFFRASEPGSLFDYGEFVCYGCMPDWWSSISPRLSVAEREKMEGRLSSWLRRYHRAEILKGEDREKRTGPSQSEFQIVVQCTECRGSGKLLEGERCRFCDGLGTVCIAAPRSVLSPKDRIPPWEPMS